MIEDDFVWIMIKGSLLIITAVVVLSAAAFIVLSVLPLAIGYAIALAISRLWDAIHRRPSLSREKPAYRVSHLDLGRRAVRGEAIQKREENEKAAAEIEADTRIQGEASKELPKKEPTPLDKNLYLERELSEAQRGELERRGYKRLKTSAFGDSGASYYLVNKRWNESKEHAFFCFLIESELRKRGKEAELFVNNGPDVVFEHKGRRYCFDVETGTNLARDKGKVARKFGCYAQEYHCSYIFVTKKKLKHKYRKYGRVVTRASLLQALNGTLK